MMCYLVLYETNLNVFPNVVLTEKSLDHHSDITSDSSGVGTCNSGGSGSSYEANPSDPSLILPGTMVVCVENFVPQSSHHLKLTEGDIIEGALSDFDLQKMS